MAELFKMFTVILFAGFLSLTAHAVQGKCIETIEVPEGITVHKIISTWEEAHLLCKNEGAVLASPINTELLNNMKSLISLNSAQYFIGTKASHYAGPFVSVEGVPLDNMTSAVLEMVQQLDPRDGDCLSMDEHSIRVVPCCMRLPFMCYKTKMETFNTTTHLLTETTEQATTTESTTISATESEIEWSTKSTAESWINSFDIYNVLRANTEWANTTKFKTYHDYLCNTNYPGYKVINESGSCYKIHTEEKLWDEASAACEAENAHLLVIDDVTEMQLFISMDLSDVEPFAYIGLRDYNRDGNWTTVTGKKLSEISIQWYPGAPRVAAMTCGAIYSTGLVDNLYCDTAKRFICEKEITTPMYKPY